MARRGARSSGGTSTIEANAGATGQDGQDRGPAALFPADRLENRYWAPILPGMGAGVKWGGG